MLHYSVSCDFETGERAGAGGFQVTFIEDEQGNDCTSLLKDRGKHYFDLAEVRADIATATGLPLEEVTVDSQ